MSEKDFTDLAEDLNKRISAIAMALEELKKMPPLDNEVKYRMYLLFEEINELSWWGIEDIDQDQD